MLPMSGVQCGAVGTSVNGCACVFSFLNLV